MKKIKLLFVCLFASAALMAQGFGPFNGIWVFDQAVIEEIQPLTGESMSINAYTYGTLAVPGVVAEMIIYGINTNERVIVTMSGMVFENPDVQAMGGSFSFSEKGQPVKLGTNEYVIDVQEDIATLTPQAFVCTEDNCFRVVSFTLKRFE